MIKTKTISNLQKILYDIIQLHNDDYVCMNKSGFPFSLVKLNIIF